MKPSFHSIFETDRNQPELTPKTFFISVPVVAACGLVVALIFIAPLLLFPAYMGPIALAEIFLFAIGQPVLFDFIDSVANKAIKRYGNR